MSTMMNGTTDTAKDVIASAKDGADHAMNTAKHAAGSAKVEAGHALSKTLSFVLDGVKAVAGIATVVRALDWVGLRRRRDPLLSFAIFSAGVAVGASVGVLFAPMPGAALRSTIRRRFKSLLGEARDASERLEEKVEAAADAVKDATTGANGHA
jgi:hypothetical protein